MRIRIRDNQSGDGKATRGDAIHVALRSDSKGSNDGIDLDMYELDCYIMGRLLSKVFVAMLGRIQR